MYKVANAIKTSGTPTSIIIDPAGKFLYVTNQGKKALQRFAIDSESGQLKEVEKIALGFTPQSMVISREFK